MKFLCTAFACLYRGEGRGAGGLFTLPKWLLISGFSTYKEAFKSWLLGRGWGTLKEQQWWLPEWESHERGRQNPLVKPKF